MPGLESFCVCTAIGLGSIYLLQISWFVAWMSLDEKRISAGGDGLQPVDLKLWSRSFLGHVRFQSTPAQKQATSRMQGLFDLDQ